VSPTLPNDKCCPSVCLSVRVSHAKLSERAMVTIKREFIGTRAFRFRICHRIRDRKYWLLPRRTPCHPSSVLFSGRPGPPCLTNARIIAEGPRMLASTSLSGGLVRRRPNVLWTSRRHLYSILFATGSQCSCYAAGVTWPSGLRSSTVLTTACRTLCRGASVDAGKPATTALQ